MEILHYEIIGTSPDTTLNVTELINDGEVSLLRWCSKSWKESLCFYFVSRQMRSIYGGEA